MTISVRPRHCTVSSPIPGDLANYGLLMTTFVSLGLCGLFLVVSAGFGVFNAFSDPIETWAGPIGLYYYNGFAGKRRRPRSTSEF